MWFEVRMRYKRWRDRALENIRKNGAMSAESLVMTTAGVGGKNISNAPTARSAVEVLKRDKRFKGEVSRRFGTHSITVWR